MKVSGFSFIKNAIQYDYPIVESIKSILPICDEFVVAVGKSEDETLDLISQIDKNKIKVIETEWDENLKEGGRVLAVETDKAFAQISKDSDWAFYLQGDEVVHEKYLDTILQAMHRLKDEKSIDGLLFNYRHFYGSYDYYVGLASNWYNHEIRVIKNDSSIYSFKDAQGFRKGKNQKLNVCPIDAWVYHYGWVKEPKAMQRKQETFYKLWHDESWGEQHIVKAEAFDYAQHGINELIKFQETHPEVMKKRLESRNWQFEHDISFNKTTLKAKFKSFLNRSLGIDLNYKNYIVNKRIKG
jgi:hypothetical protein